MLKPLHDSIWIDPEEAPAYHQYKQLKHIVVPQAYAHGPEDRPVWGIVKAVGEDVQKVKRHQRVLFGKWAPARLRYQEKEYMFIKEADVLAVDEGWSDTRPSLLT